LQLIFIFNSMTDEYFMMQALKEAKRAFEDGEIPIGAVVVVNEKIIARGHNMTERLNDPTAHAEMIAGWEIFNGCDNLYNYRTMPYVQRCIILEQNKTCCVWCG